jgi:hypothetical protein
VMAVRQWISVLWACRGQVLILKVKCIGRERSPFVEATPWQSLFMEPRFAE